MTGACIRKAYGLDDNATKGTGGGQVDALCACVVLVGISMAYTTITQRRDAVLDRSNTIAIGPHGHVCGNVYGHAYRHMCRHVHRLVSRHLHRHVASHVIDASNLYPCLRHAVGDADMKSTFCDYRQRHSTHRPTGFVI